MPQTNTHDAVAEELTKAAQTVSLAISDLRSALSGSNAVEALVLLPLIAQASKLQSDIEALSVARTVA